MNCEHIQELILTDYLDGRMPDAAKKHLEQHLGVCPECLQFAQAAQKTAFAIFEGLNNVEPPDHLWSRIEGAILNENRDVVVHEPPRWIERLKALIQVPQPVFALATILILFLAMGTVRQFVSQKALSDGSVEYLVSLTDTSSADVSNDDADLGTTVEQYFL